MVMLQAAITEYIYYNYTGGLIGYSDSNINQSYSTGGVIGGNANSSYAGGLIGYNTGSVAQAYTTSAVSGGNASFQLHGRPNRIQRW